MATLGLSYIIEGAAQLLWGTQVHGLDLGIEDIPFDVGGVFISQFDIFAALVAAGMVAILSAFFGTPALASAFVLSPTTSSRRWPSVSSCPGFGRASGGGRPCCSGRRLLWGARLGVQFSLSLVVLKALPVLVLGGFDSIVGAIIGGLVIGASEKLAEVYIGEYFGGGIEGWFAYVVALAFLLIRPSGLFGQKLVERV